MLSWNAISGKCKQKWNQYKPEIDLTHMASVGVNKRYAF